MEIFLECALIFTSYFGSGICGNKIDGLYDFGGLIRRTLSEVGLSDAFIFDKR